LDYILTIQVLYDLKKFAESQENSRLVDCAIYVIEELQANYSGGDLKDEY